jgi:hypothetical protein
MGVIKPKPLKYQMTALIKKNEGVSGVLILTVKSGLDGRDSMAIGSGGAGMLDTVAATAGPHELTSVGWGDTPMHKTRQSGVLNNPKVMGILTEGFSGGGEH